MTVKVTDLSPQFLKQYRDASRMAIDAATETYLTAVRKRMRSGYYTSQRFRSTAQIIKHVMKELPVFRGNGWYQQAGVPAGISVRVKPNGKPPRKPFSVGDIALAWELGHHNKWTGRWERVPIFKPVAIESAKAMIDTYNRVLNRYLERGKAVK